MLFNEKKKTQKLTKKLHTKKKKMAEGTHSLIHYRSSLFGGNAMKLVEYLEKKKRKRLFFVYFLTMIFNCLFGCS